MTADWHDPTYLRRGNARQQQAHAVLAALDLWPRLRGYDPVLAGTIPLGIDMAGSDLDVLCEVPPARQVAFEQLLRAHYGELPGFQLGPSASRHGAATVASFRYAEVEVEIFGQNRPTRQQDAYRHLVVEAAILHAGGERWRAAVRRLKSQGLKTEPAFAALLGLPGDPYAALLALEAQTPAELAALLATRTPGERNQT